MNTVDLKEKLKELYPNNKFVDKHSLLSLQFTAYDMIDFAKQISDFTVYLCKENVINSTLFASETDTTLTRGQIAAIENTKTQIK